MYNLKYKTYNIHILKKEVTGNDFTDPDHYAFEFAYFWGTNEKKLPVLQITLGVIVTSYIDKKIAEFVVRTEFDIESPLKEIPYESFCFLFFQAFGSLQLAYMNEMVRTHKDLIDTLSSPDFVLYEEDFEEQKNKFIQAFFP